jgi:diketogulonate reductase-like aldo/keto reductase
MTIPQQFQLYDGTTIPSIGLGTCKCCALFTCVENCINELKIGQAKPGEVGAAVKFALAAGYRHIDCAHICIHFKLLPAS